jgi:nicotinamide-nucleotide amidase
MRAEIVAIGDELTSGARLDTNSQWISRRLGELGVGVAYHTTVGDELSQLASVLETALDRTDLVVASGGLGPTADDLTREALAQATGRPLEPNGEALRAVRERFESRGISMPDRNRLQALLPRGSRMIPNPHGTAPGISLLVDRPGRPAALVVALPGVPAELFEMWDDSVENLIRAMQPSTRVICHRRIKVFGAGESHVEAMLPDLIRRGRIPSVGITVSQATVTLRIAAEGASADECRRLIDPTIETIRGCLGRLVFGEEDDELEHAVARLLIERNQRLVTVEWGTGGLLATWLDTVADGAPWYAGGAVIGRHPQWDLARAPAGDCGAQESDEDAVRHLAWTHRERTGVDYAIAVGGPVAIGPSASGQYLMALAGDRGVSVSAQSVAGHPALVKVRAAKQALNTLRLMLLDQAAQNG